MFPLLSTRANPLGPLLLCDRTSVYPAIMQSEKTIRGMPKRITIPPGGQFEFTRPKLATATISIGMPTALLAVIALQFRSHSCKCRAKERSGVSIVNLGCYGKVGAPHCQRGVRQRSARQHVDSMISAKNREMKQAR